MKAVVIGDLGWKYLYHLGDEAMSVAAAGVLDRMSVDVTLVGGNPEPTTRRYGYDSVRRPGFKKAMSTSVKADRLESLSRALAGSGQLPEGSEEIAESVRSCDAVVIGGGGNLNSAGEHHLYDRVALARMAKRFGKPLFVSSQTVGPALTDYESRLVKEIAETAECFGCREPTSARFMSSLVDSSNVYETMDDAILLEPAAASKVDRTLENKPLGRFVIASFTHHVGTSGLPVATYRSFVTDILDEIADEFDVDVVMIPHLGKFSPANPASDQTLNSAIVAASKTGRIIATPMIEADVVLALTRDAVFTVSTRYHPLIFGPAVGTPAFSFELSDYSRVRMQGALANLGLSRFSLSRHYLSRPRLFTEYARALLADSVSLDKHLSYAVGVRRFEQLSWWQDIVASIGDGQFSHSGYRHWLPDW